MIDTYRFLGCDADHLAARTVLFGAPFDGTVSYRPGARFAPQAMRAASDGLETYSPYQHTDLIDCAVHDAGDLEFSFGNVQKTLSQIEEYTRQCAALNKRPIMIGGEHLVTYGAVKALALEHAHLNVLHFDAHADLREQYLGEAWSHATVMRRISQLDNITVHQFGIRSGTKQEIEQPPENVYRHPLQEKPLTELIKRIGDMPCYVSIDLDVLDPSVFPGTGTPEPGGVDFHTLHKAVLALSPLRLIGADMVELCPHYDASGVSVLVACKLLRELMIVMNR